MRSAESGADNAELKNTPHLEHVPVLLREAVDLLAPKPGGVYVDGTLGGGGHADEILRRSGPDGVLIGIDQDAEAVTRSSERLAEYGDRAIFRRADFRDIEGIASGLGHSQVDGVILDLGVSWFHLRSAERGFSFMLDGPLDMRMDRERRRTAADLVNSLPREDLTRIIREYGEEKKASAIARAIERERGKGPIMTTARLAEIVYRVFPRVGRRRIHPATRTFQALRIAVNDELGALNEGLDGAIRILKSGGRLVVISFHSLEDRMVKQKFSALAKGCICPPKHPVCTCGRRPLVKALTKKPVVPGDMEAQRNPASRSAKLRAAEKI